MKFIYYGTNGYTPIVLKDFFDFVHYMAAIPKMASKRHTFNPALFSADRIFSSKILGIKYAITLSDAGYKLLTARKAMPRAALVKKSLILHQLKEHLEYIKRPDFDPEK